MAGAIRYCQQPGCKGWSTRGGLCPAHKLQQSGRVKIATREWRTAHDRVRYQCRRAGIDYVPKPPPSPRSGPTTG